MSDLKVSFLRSDDSEEPATFTFNHKEGQEEYSLKHNT
jgi:hypothetical protein